MYGIIAKNTGMWGITTWCHNGDKVELYATKEEAQKVATQRNQQSIINQFTQYFAEEYKQEN